MDTADKLTINVNGIPEGGLELKGQLPEAIFAIEESEHVSCPSPLSYDLRVANVDEDILVTGRVSTALRCRCDRCLSYYTQSIENPNVTHLIESPKEAQLDLTERVREDILISFPRKQLCASDCHGICPGCGQNLNTRQCGCKNDRSGPNVWESLDGLFDEDST